MESWNWKKSTRRKTPKLNVFLFTLLLPPPLKVPVVPLNPPFCDWKQPNTISYCGVLCNLPFNLCMHEIILTNTTYQKYSNIKCDSLIFKALGFETIGLWCHESYCIFSLPIRIICIWRIRRSTSQQLSTLKTHLQSNVEMQLSINQRGFINPTINRRNFQSIIICVCYINMLFSFNLLLRQ